MKLQDAMREYGLRNHTTPEELEMRFSGMDGKTLLYGDRVLVAGFYWNGKGKPSYFGAVYEFLGNDHSCEGVIGLRSVSGLIHHDEGHAIEWALDAR